MTSAKSNASERDRAEGMLAEIIDGSPIPMFVIDKQHRVTHWNKALESLSGMKKSQVIGTDRQWVAFYTEKRPVMADLIVDGAGDEEIEAFYGGGGGKSALIDDAYEGEGLFPDLGNGGRWLHFTASPIKDEKGNIAGSIETLQDITAGKKAEHALNERVKELRCLYDIGVTAQKPGITLEQLYQEVANLLPNAWQYPDITCARIVVDGSEYRTENYRTSQWRQSSDIEVHGEKVGTVAVGYLEEKPSADEGPFTTEERLLIDAVARRLARITDQRRLEENCRFYAQQVTRAQEEERKRIARELHDELAQTLLLLMQGLDYLTSTKRKRLSNPELVKSLNKLRNQAIDTLDGLRRTAQDLRPPILDHLGLLAALEWLADEMKKQGIDTRFQVIGEERSLPAEAELLLFRIAQEATANTRKHAQASQAWITIEFGDGKTGLTVGDNGKGFELPQRLGDFAGTGKLGLAGMQERARLIGGDLELKSEVGKGTTVTVEVPT